jgi:hypothetical protein
MIGDMLRGGVIVAALLGGNVQAYGEGGRHVVEPKRDTLPFCVPSRRAAPKNCPRA